MFHSTSARRRVLFAAAASVLAVTGSVAVFTAARAATGCRVDYTVTNQWQGGFGANVTLTNLGDPVTSWTLTWTFSAGQIVTQLWGGDRQPVRHPGQRRQRGVERRGG